MNWINDSNFSLELASLLTKVKHAKRSDDNYYGFIFNEGLGGFKNENSYYNMNYSDVGFRILSLFRYWNIIQYYFPYKNLIGEDWKGVLKEFIPKLNNASNEIEYKLTVLELIVRVHDTHANIWGDDQTLKIYWGVNYAPVEIRFIENKAVVTDYYEQNLGMKSGLQIGDVITKINGKPVEKIVLDKLKYTSASNYPRQLMDIGSNLLRTNDSALKIEYTRDGKLNEIEIKTFSTNKININKRNQRKDTCFKFINPDISYIYPGTIKNDYLPDIMNTIKNTKGLIIDLRCYPSETIVYSLGKYLMPDSIAFVRLSSGSNTDPGTFVISDVLKVGEKNGNYYKGKVIILINEITWSNAEFTTMAFRLAPKATVIGSTTAGSDGNVTQFNLPGGLYTGISGFGVYYPDGRETQRIGIVPDIEVKPTIDGIKMKKDELLEKAIEIIKEH
ncbi:MAG: peptidase [Ignavibacteria bacterium]|nr:peptidase [Ignavibacteria bacterium]